MAQRWSVFKYIVSREPKKLQTNVVKWKPLYTFLAQKTKSGEQFFCRSVHSYWCNQCKRTIYAIQTTITTRSCKMISRENTSNKVITDLSQKMFSWTPWSADRFCSARLHPCIKLRDVKKFHPPMHNDASFVYVYTKFWLWIKKLPLIINDKLNPRSDQ